MKARGMYAFAGFAVSLIVAFMSAMEHRAEAIPPPPMPFCQWEGVTFLPFLNQTNAVLVARATCPTLKPDGCYIQVVSTVWAYDLGHAMWIPVPGMAGDSGNMGPNCGSIKSYQVTVNRASLPWQDTDYALTVTAYDRTFGSEKMGTGEVYWSE